jgi:hypothetical protein
MARMRKGTPIWTVSLDVRGLISALFAGPTMYPETIKQIGPWVHIQITRPTADRIEKCFKEGITFAATNRSAFKPREAGDKKQTYCEFRSFFDQSTVVGEMYFHHAQGSVIKMLPLKPGGKPVRQLVVDAREQRKRPEYWLAGTQAWVQKILQDCL